VVTRQEWDERYPWLHGLSDEQISKIWQTYDRVYDHNRCAEPDALITTHDEIIEHVGELLNDTISPDQLEYLEDELQRDEEYKLAAWMRELRHVRESVDEERARYEREDKLFEELARRRQLRRPRD
jgi:hypothetical protein